MEYVRTYFDIVLHISRGVHIAKIPKERTVLASIWDHLPLTVHAFSLQFHTPTIGSSGGGMKLQPEGYIFRCRFRGNRFSYLEYDAIPHFTVDSVWGLMLASHRYVWPRVKIRDCM